VERLRGAQAYVMGQTGLQRQRLIIPKLGGEKAMFVERVLDVRQGELCWIVGTVYMEMALKPNVLDDISKDVSLSPKLIKLFKD